MSILLRIKILCLFAVAHCLPHTYSRDTSLECAYLLLGYSLEGVTVYGSETHVVWDRVNCWEMA